MKVKLLISFIILLFLSASAQAGILDSIMYKTAELEKGEKVLVERFTGKVRYFWNKDTNEWTSTGLTPELERTFQFMYEQTKAPKNKPRD